MLLRRELDAVRSQGYAIAQEEYEADLNAAGAAVRDHRGDVVASISVSGPTFRLTPGRLPELGMLVRHAAERISARLGHRPAGAAVMATTRRPGTPGPAGAIPGRQVDAAAGARHGRRPAVGVAGPVFGN
jgi:hypothetical protein